MVNCSFESCSHYTPESLNVDQLNNLNDIMRPGMLCLEGFIGLEDDLETVYQTDKAALKTLGVTHFQIGEALANLAEKVVQSKSKRVMDGDLVITVNDNLDENLMKCPFQQDGENCHSGRKLFSVYKQSTNETLYFSELAIGLIRDHAFFENSKKYRVDPALACSVLGLSKSLI